MSKKPRPGKLEFGGRWTSIKLAAVEDYLPEYTKIFTRNPGARYFSTMYVDAFAGTGRIAYMPDLQETLFIERENYVKGSASRALEVKPEFNRYIFIESDPDRYAVLEQLKVAHRDKNDRIDVRNDDANLFLKRWCKETNWKQWRAVVLLDPYAMDVPWSTIEALARTQGIDLWWLFPCGAFNRLLTRGTKPPQSWRDALTRICGTDAWEQRFYEIQTQEGLFGPMQTEQKISSFTGIQQFLRERLESIFVGVAKQPLYLVNSQNTPIFMLFFAASNPKGAATATRIANWIIEHGGN
jgi:three-Cys-motif partner protein